MMLSIVIPVYNEEESLRELYNRLVKVIRSMGIEYELIFIDDGSTDASLKIIKDLASYDSSVKYRAFTRNFGHEAASTAGLDIAKGDAVILMDADLQDPPELIPKMMELWKDGNQVVFARRKKRRGERLFRRISAKIFYRFINIISDYPIPVDTGDFRLMDRQIVDALRLCREHNRFVRGLTSWVGYKQVALEYERDQRYAGKSKYDFGKLFILMLDVITGFSTKPLRLVTFFGFIVTVLSLAIAGWIVFQKLFLGLDIKGYALLASGLFFLGGVQIFFLGVIGEYIGKVFRQVQQRPLYLIREEDIG